MGYRSNVGIVISKKARTLMLLHNKEFPADFADSVEETYEGNMRIFIEQIKWYKGWFKPVDQVISLFHFFDENNYEDEYRFVRIGEELDDIEISGCMIDSVDVSQEIVFY